MLPPGSPPSASLVGLIWRYSYAGPPASATASVRRCNVSSAATTPSSVAPSLSCTSSIERTSGARRLWTMSPASASNFAAGSFASRFSTLNVATDSWSASGADVVSRASPPDANAGSDVTWSLKLPKL